MSKPYLTAFVGLSFEFVNELTISQINDYASLGVSVIITLTTVYRVLTDRRKKKK